MSLSTILFFILVIAFWKLHMMHGWKGLIPNILGTMFLCSAIGSFFDPNATLGSFLVGLALSALFYAIPRFMLKK